MTTEFLYLMNKVKYNSEDLKDHYGVSAVIKDKDSRILMQLHKKYGFWTVPVGKVDLGQDIVEGMKREVFEECNLVVEECREVASKLYEYERDGRMVKVDTHIFEVTKYFGVLENKEPHKHLEQKFMTVEEIRAKNYLSDTTKIYLAILDSRV